MKKFKARLSVMDESNVYGLHIPVPLDVSIHFKKQGIKRFICSINNCFDKHSALMPMGDGSDYILLNKQEVKTIGLTLGELIEVCLSEDNSKYGMAMPEELAELLVQDAEGDKHFHGLTPGKQRALIHIVAKLKNSDSRIRKAIGIVDYLKSNSGALDFRAMNEYLKRGRLK